MTLPNFLSSEEIRSLGFQSVGSNTLISRKASFYGAESISIGNNCRIDDFCILSAGEGGIVLGRNIHISHMSSIVGSGEVKIGDYCSISAKVSIFSSNDDYSGAYR